MMLYWMLPLVFALAWTLTYVLRRYALARSVMDIPNERSSHTVPTPRGGGVAIVLAFLLTLPLLLGQGLISLELLIGMGGAGLLIAVIGFADDHGHIAVRWRLLGHFVSAAWLLFWIDGLGPVSFPGGTVDLGLVGDVLAVFALVWVLNLYNFMDGIDGIAGIEAVSVCVAGALFYWLSDAPDQMALPLVLAAAALGFLLWNLPPAKIFMGDAGSGFVGLILGGLALQAAWVAPRLLWCWLIMLGVFIVDATWTLVRRLLQGERIAQAHRSHAYQRASRRFGGHGKVTWAVAAINVGWLMPVALWVERNEGQAAYGFLLAYSPLVLLVCWFGAGRREPG